MKLFNVDFEYTERAAIGNIVTDTPEQAVEGAKALAEKGGVKNPRNFTATEVTDFEKNDNITVQ